MIGRKLTGSIMSCYHMYEMTFRPSVIS